VTAWQRWRVFVFVTVSTVASVAVAIPVVANMPVNAGSITAGLIVLGGVVLGGVAAIWVEWRDRG
jgi:hypothetical protein